MSFANPLMLLLFVPVAVAAWRLLRRGRRSGIRFSAVGRLPAKAAGWRAQVAALTPFLLLAGLSLLTLAAARPRSSLAHEKKSVDAIAIAMTVDVSGSMAETDLAPKGTNREKDWTRLAVVKKLFAEFVQERPDDLIGLVTFGGYAATRSPLTADHAALLHVLKGVELPPQEIIGDRLVNADEYETAIGDGLAVAIARLKDVPLKSKVVILLSDGNQTVEKSVSPDEAADVAAKLGIKVYAIGIGTKPRLKGYDWLGRAIKSYPMDEKQLRSIAKKTGGTYFAVNDRDSLEKALEEIDQLETTQLDADVYNRWKEHFVPFLLAGALLVLLAVTLSMSASRRVA